MDWYNRNVDVSEMQDQTFTSVKQVGYDQIHFINDKVRYILYHDQDCCESVTVEEIIGDLEDLENLPLLIAREDTNADGPETCHGESYTYTFYNFATYKGYVTIRFLGESNGYYSEEVYCRKEILSN